jgi:hypothetical protein
MAATQCERREVPTAQAQRQIAEYLLFASRAVCAWRRMQIIRFCTSLK